MFHIEDMVEVVVCKVDFENGPEKGAIVLSQLWGLSLTYTSELSLFHASLHASKGI